MNKFKKVILLIVCLISLVACGKKEESVQVNKEGTLYEIGKDISFYYPADFELTSKSDDENSVQFNKENQVLFYKVEDNIYDNDIKDRMELYKGELESLEASVIEVKEPALESGLKCYEYIGEYKKAGLSFMYLVYFDEKATYIYGYEANEDEYEDNISQIVVYLESFTKATGL
ncbi:MAG: hypothetical protein ACI4SR_02150 [Faecalibacillus sp.]